MKLNRAVITGSSSILLSIALAGEVNADGSVYFNAQFSSEQVTYVQSVPRPCTGWSAHFYHSLRPYGVWLEHPAYGWVWQSADSIQCPEWNPYVNGLIWTQTGAASHWRPRFAWGFTTYRFGSWVNLDCAGWVWVPGGRCNAVISQPIIVVQSYAAPVHHTRPHPHDYREDRREERRQPAPVMPTRRTERVQSVAQSRSQSTAQSTAHAPARTPSPATSRAGRTINVVRQRR